MPTPKRTSKKKPPKQLPPNWAKLTKAEKRLIQHPPTPRTWRCRSKRKGEAGTEPCGFINSGLRSTCGMCGTSKPSKPTLLWPLYLKACAKAGIEPKGAE
jgi:hypothetical protein